MRWREVAGTLLLLLLLKMMKMMMMMEECVAILWILDGSLDSHVFTAVLVFFTAVGMVNWLAHAACLDAWNAVLSHERFPAMDLW